jgi:hypothetical protein
MVFVIDGVLFHCYGRMISENKVPIISDTERSSFCVRQEQTFQQLTVSPAELMFLVLFFNKNKPVQRAVRKRAKCFDINA